MMLKRQTNIKVSDLLPAQYQLLTSTKRIIGLVAGYRSGKTYSLLLKALDMLLHAKNPLTNKSLIGVCCIDYLKLHAVFALPFCAILDKYKIKYKYLKYRFIQTSYGIIRLLTAQKPLKIVAYTMTGFIIDLIDILSLQYGYLLYKNALARLSGYSKAQLVIASTPLGYRALYKIFIELADDTKILIKAKTTDNKYLPKEYIDQLYAQYDSKLIERYINGLFVSLNGMNAYWQFNRLNNVKDIKYIITLQDTLHIGVDYNVDPYTAVIAVNNASRLHVIKLYYLNGYNTLKFCRLLKLEYPNNNIIIYPDATGNQRRTSADKTDHQIMESHGFKLIYRIMPIKDRLYVVNNTLLKLQIIIDMRCKHLINDLTKVNIKDNTIDKSQLKAGLTHISDALGYLVYNIYKPKERLLALTW